METKLLRPCVLENPRNS